MLILLMDLIKTFHREFVRNLDFGDPCIKPFSYENVLRENQFSTCAGIIRTDKFIPFDVKARDC